MSEEDEEVTKTIRFVDLEDMPDGSTKVTVEMDLETLTAFAKRGLMDAIVEAAEEIERLAPGVDLSQVASGEVLKDAV